jgi:hypothetical protein
MPLVRPHVVSSLIGLLALFALQANAQQVYRIVGPDGRVTFSDKPPVDAQAKLAPMVTQSSGGSSNGSLPFELRQAGPAVPAGPISPAAASPSPKRRSAVPKMRRRSSASRAKAWSPSSPSAASGCAAIPTANGASTWMQQAIRANRRCPLPGAIRSLHRWWPCSVRWRRQQLRPTPRPRPGATRRRVSRPRAPTIRPASSSEPCAWPACVRTSSS